MVEPDSNRSEDPRVSRAEKPSAAREPIVALVLGAGGSRGKQWILGSLDALKETTGFTQDQAAVVQGTSIGAFLAGRLGQPRPLEPGVFEALVELASVPDAPGRLDRAVTTVRRSVGNVIAALCPPGFQNPRDWIQKIDPDPIATVVSARCWPPGRRATDLATAQDPAGEIAASGAIPVGAKPVELDGHRHTDGAVLSVTSADLISPDDADLLIVIAPMAASDGGSLVSRTGRHQLAVELQAWHEAAKPVIVLGLSGAEYTHRGDEPRHFAAAGDLVRSLRK